MTRKAAARRVAGLKTTPARRAVGAAPGADTSLEALDRVFAVMGKLEVRRLREEYRVTEREASGRSVRLVWVPSAMGSSPGERSDPLHLMLGARPVGTLTIGDAEATLEQLDGTVVAVLNLTDPLKVEVIDLSGPRLELRTPSSAPPFEAVELSASPARAPAAQVTSFDQAKAEFQLRFEPSLAARGRVLVLAALVAHDWARAVAGGRR